MNRCQKIAWYNLIVILVSLALTGAAVGTLAIIVGMPGALGGLGFLGISGLLGLSPILFRTKRGQLGFLGFDERDLQIYRRAIIVAYSIFWVFFTAACMVPWFIIGPKGNIPVYVLPGMLAGGFVIVQLIQSIVTVILYSMGGKNHE